VGLSMCECGVSLLCLSESESTNVGVPLAYWCVWRGREGECERGREGESKKGLRKKKLVNQFRKTRGR